jgi:uncharacterized membrane protein
MSDSSATTPRQRRIASYVFLGVGLLNLVVGVVAGALITIIASVVMLIVGGALLVTGVTGSGRPPTG